MRALVDRHQADLFYALQLLLEDRLGIEVYTPVGREWFDAGYWQFGYEHLGDLLANQYLTIDAKYTDAGDHWETIDPAHVNRSIRCITLDQFRALGGWTHIVATVQDNQRGFHRLAGEVGARYVYQVGNTGQQVDWDLDPLALMSSEVPALGRHVRMHQPFDHLGTFRYREPVESRRIVSLVNCMPQIACWPVLRAYRNDLDDFSFRVFGINGPDGDLHPVEAIADEIAASAFVWHDKHHGDGFGHVIHNAAAVGRPLIGHASHYDGRMARHLWQDGLTAIDLDQRSMPENVALIRAIVRDPARYRAMCENIRAEFDSIDWDGETAAAAALLL